MTVKSFNELNMSCPKENGRTILKHTVDRLIRGDKPHTIRDGLLKHMPTKDERIKSAYWMVS